MISSATTGTRAAAQGAGPAAGVGWFGVLPDRHGFVGEGLPPEFLDRWDAWFGRASAQGVPEATTDSPVWRFATRAGLFGPLPAAGVWRLSRDRGGRVYPFVLARLAPPPAPDDPWYDRLARVLTAITTAPFPTDRLAARLGDLSTAGAALEQSVAIRLWRDDWEVHELAFPDARAFATFGMPGAG